MGYLIDARWRRIWLVRPVSIPILRNEASDEADSREMCETAGWPSSGESTVKRACAKRPTQIAWYVFFTRCVLNMSTAAEKAAKDFAKRRQPVVSLSRRCTAWRFGSESWTRRMASALFGSSQETIPAGLSATM